MPDAPTLGELESESVADTMRAIIAQNAVPENQRDDNTVLEGQESGDNPAPTQESVDNGSTGTRERDEKGRFVAKEEKEESAASGDEGSSDEHHTVPDEEADDGGEVEAAYEPLPEWSAEQHQEFYKLSKPAQKFLLDQVKAADEKASAGSKYEPIEQILAPRRDAFARDGLDDVSALRQLFALSDMAAQDPVAFTRMFVNQRGIRPEHIWGEYAPQQGQQQHPGDDGQFSDDPLYHYMQQENAQIKQQLDQVMGLLSNQYETQQSSAQQQVANEIQSFSSATDERGRPKHPYFNEVRSLMGTFIGSGEAQDLESAYDMACRAKPAVRAKLEAAERARADEQARKESRAKAEAARKAGKSVSGSPATQRTVTEVPDDIREAMRQQFAERGINVEPVW